MISLSVRLPTRLGDSNQSLLKEGLGGNNAGGVARIFTGASGMSRKASSQADVNLHARYSMPAFGQKAAMKPRRLERSGPLRTASRPSHVRNRNASFPHTPDSNHTMNKLSQQRDFQLGRVPTSSTNSVGNLAIYEECLAIRRRLAKVDPCNTQWRHDEACLLDQIGNEYRNARMKRQAIAAYEASLAVLRHLAEIDPRNTQRQLDVAISLNKLGDVKLDGVDSWGAITCYQANVAIWRQ